jgi:hypothetical protein
MAGHDYMTAPEVKAISNQDWSLCMNGTRQEGAVKGAVNGFFAKLGLKVWVTAEAAWPTWYVRKP